MHVLSYSYTNTTSHKSINFTNHAADASLEDDDCTAEQAGSEDMWNAWGDFAEPGGQPAGPTVAAESGSAPTDDAAVQGELALEVSVRASLLILPQPH